MLSDALYDLCLPVLNDHSLEEEDKTDKLEELLRKETSLTGKSLENSVLDALWRFRTGTANPASPPPSRHTVIRRPSPAPWQIGRTPTPSQSSPRIIRPPPGLTRSSTASPFTSPRASPRLALATPYIPHSPRLDGYQFSEPSPTQETYGDMGSDAVEWLVNDDGISNASSSFTGDGPSADWNAANAMDPYDLLRSILRDEKSNDEIEKALEENAYDLSATIMALMEGQGDALFPVASAEPERIVLVGKSMSPAFRPSTPIGQQKSHILCKYWLSTGSCARADCRFSHDPSKTVCKYWLSGNCLAGTSCLFSHDPSLLLSRMMIENGTSTPSSFQSTGFFQDFESFPSLVGAVSSQNFGSASFNALSTSDVESRDLASGFQTPPPTLNPPPGLNPLATFRPSSASGSRTQSRPSSRHTSRAPTPSIPLVNDDEAFPTLGSAVKVGKKHHGKRGGHGHHSKDSATPSTMAELVRMSPTPSPAQLNRKGLQDRALGRSRSSFLGVAGGASRESEFIRQIPPPENIPWLATGDAVNKAYMKARGEAFKHGGLRNKFLQSAAQAYNRHDTRAAKALSLRGQAENNLMRQAHREAARILYDERNRELNHGPGRDIFVDLHGLHPTEIPPHLDPILASHENDTPQRPIYIITGTGSHSKNGRDKLGRAVKQYLQEWRYAFREFGTGTVPTADGGATKPTASAANSASAAAAVAASAGIIGVLPASWDRRLVRERRQQQEEGKTNEEGGEQKSTKLRILRREDLDAEGGSSSSTTLEDTDERAMLPRG